MRELPDRYAVVFRERDGAVAAGSLELNEEELVLSGRTADGECELHIALAGIVDVHVGRQAEQRLRGYPTLVLERRGKPPVQIAPLGAGLLHEIADLLTALTAVHGESDHELAVIVPLRPGCLGRVQELLRLGPPLDPASLGLTSHHVYLRDEAAVFVFRGPQVHARVRRAMRSPALWRAGIAWLDCIAGQPQIETSPETASGGAEPAYSWEAEGAR